MYLFTLLTGDDQTSVILAMTKQEASTSTKRRRKRQAVAENNPGNSTFTVVCTSKFSLVQTYILLSKLIHMNFLIVHEV